MSGRAGAVVVLRPGGTLCVAAVGHYLSDGGLIDHYLPERLELVDRLPKTSSGNVRKQGLQKKSCSEPEIRSAGRFRRRTSDAMEAARDAVGGS